MKKILFFFFFFVLLSNYSHSETKHDLQNTDACNNALDEKNFSEIHKTKIKKIELDVNNYKKWTINNVKILTTRSRFIPNNLKKNFKGKVKVIYQDGSICFMKARVRHSGDAKDHIAFKGNSVIQSLDIKLIDGNIRGITKFKLFKPDVRGNIDDVVLMTQILRDFGYLAPRSIKVQARVNQTESIMLFQEKAAKELLEFNNRREGPILEGDQKFFFETVKNIPDNQLSNWSVGMPNLRNKTSKVMLSKITNTNLVDRGEIHKQMSLNAINNLNSIYLYWSNRFQDEKNNYFFFDYDLDNSLLALFDRSKIKQLDTYNLFLQATNSHHALSPTNRKFYWNSIENYFEPILYDANPEIEASFSSTTTAVARMPVSDYFEESLFNLYERLNAINITELQSKVKISGLNLSQDEIKDKINKILDNLDYIKNDFSQNLVKENILHNNFKPIENIYEKFNTNLREINSDVYLIKHEDKELLKCKIFLEDCKFYQVIDKDLQSLLEGELQIDNKHYQYVGKKIDLKDLSSNDRYKMRKFMSSTIFYENGIQLEINEVNKTLQFNQTKVGSRAYIINGKLDDVSITFNGIKDPKNLIENSFSPPNYPINLSGLTGCLSFVNIDFDNVNLFANNSSCEDTINLINTAGNINEISINNSLSDAFDADFSNLRINSLNILSALNDCTDFSGGKYDLINLNLKNCGDKAISIGEKSNVTIENINVDSADIGIATKDSSILLLKDAFLKNLRTCVSAYNKKQEFNGGFVKINDISCEKYSNKFEIDKKSRVVLKNNIQSN